MSHHPFPWQEGFLAALREWPIVQHACDAVGILRCTAYRARQADEAFAKAWEEAMDAGVDRAEHEAFRRAVQGLEEPVVYQGQLTPVFERGADGEVVVRIEKRKVKVPGAGGKMLEQEVEDRIPVQARNPDGSLRWLTLRKPSDSLLSLVLKGRRKQVYAERTELTSPDGSMSPVDDSTRSARVAQLLAAAKARKEADDNSDLA